MLQQNMWPFAAPGLLHWAFSQQEHLPPHSHRLLSWKRKCATTQRTIGEQRDYYVRDEWCDVTRIGIIRLTYKKVCYSMLSGIDIVVGSTHNLENVA